MGNALYQGLIKHLNGKTLSIQFNKGDGGNFGMQGSAGAVGISISNKMEDNQLLHEMVHAYISYQYANVKDYNASTLNHEIETHYIEYLYLRSSDHY